MQPASERLPGDGTPQKRFTFIDDQVLFEVKV
jgi:hypothetical protein